MYLSKLVLNPRSREARRDLARPYELHRTLAHAFSTPEGQDYRAAHGVLFRLEAVLPGQPPTVLVQSATAPAWDALPADYLRHPAQRKLLSVAFAAGQVLSFRLVANPTKKVTGPAQRQGRRVALLDRHRALTASATDTADFPADDPIEPTPAQLWLHRKAALAGVEVLHVVSEDFTSGGRTPDAGAEAKASLSHYGVRFEGLLRVHDPQLLAQALRQGIGPAKAFGFGLLSLGRII